MLVLQVKVTSWSGTTLKSTTNERWFSSSLLSTVAVKLSSGSGVWWARACSSGSSGTGALIDCGTARSCAGGGWAAAAPDTTSLQRDPETPNRARTLTS